MKTIQSFSVLIACLLISSCSKDEQPTQFVDEPKLVPEVSFPLGTTDYFKSSVDFDNKSGEKTISFTSNVAWRVSVDETRDGSSWCMVSPTNGEAGQATIKISVKENTSFDDRNAVVRLVYGESVGNIFVNQKQLDALTLTSDRFEVPVSGGNVTIEVKANIDYQVKISDECKDWIHLSTSQPTRALKTSNLTFTVEPSQEYDKREGRIEIISGDKKEIVTIYQAGEAILTLTKREFNISSSEQDITIEVSSNFQYSVDFPQIDWLSENNAKTRSVSTHSINLHIQENTSYDNRSTSLRIYDKNSSLSEEVVINQSQANALQIDQKEFSFDENGGVFTVNTNSNVDYKVSINDSWVSEELKPSTRALAANCHTFKVEAMTGNTPREAKISFSDKTTGITDEVIVKQRNTFYLNKNYLELSVDDNAQIVLTNETGEVANWESSDNDVVTVDNNGNVKAIGRGNATIIISTSDGKHKCECQIVVKDITDYISTYFGGGSILSNNGLIIQGSKLNWFFTNGSSSSVKLVSLQLVDGQSGNAGNEMVINTNVAAGERVGYTITIGLLGIHTPVTCRFKYEHNGKTYLTEAVYTGSL